MKATRATESEEMAKVGVTPREEGSGRFAMQARMKRVNDLSSMWLYVEGVSRRRRLELIGRVESEAFDGDESGKRGMARRLSFPNGKQMVSRD